MLNSKHWIPARGFSDRSLKMFHPFKSCIRIKTVAVVLLPLSNVAPGFSVLQPEPKKLALFRLLSETLDGPVWPLLMWGQRLSGKNLLERLTELGELTYHGLRCCSPGLLLGILPLDGHAAACAEQINWCRFQCSGKGFRSLTIMSQNWRFPVEAVRGWWFRWYKLDKLLPKFQKFFVRSVKFYQHLVLQPLFTIFSQININIYIILIFQLLIDVTCSHKQD